MFGSYEEAVRIINGLVDETVRAATRKNSALNPKEALARLELLREVARVVQDASDREQTAYEIEVGEDSEKPHEPI